MNTKARVVLVLTLMLLAGVVLMVVSRAALSEGSLAQGGAPGVVAYQGEVRVDGAPFTGTGYFKFAVFGTPGCTTYWSNDGSSVYCMAPDAAVPLAVSDGLFSVLLGDVTLDGMTHSLAADVFGQPDRYLRVWFGTNGEGGTFSLLEPDTRIAAVPYALQSQAAADADTVDGLHASELGASYQNVVIVAKSGGDYTSVQAAIDSITGAAADNAYLVWVAPGVYSETVTIKPYLHLQGAGQGATVITSTAGSGYPPTEATLTLASDASLRDLTVGNGGVGGYHIALMATAGTTRTLVADVTAYARGSGTSNYALHLSGSGTGVTMQQATAQAENGSSENYGLYNGTGAAATLRGGSFTARGGAYSRGIYSASGTMLEAESVTALGENGTSHNYGLHTVQAVATLRGGSFTGRGGSDAWGISGSGSGAMLEADSVTALGENGSDYNYGLQNVQVVATLYGGSFTGRGGTDARGIYNASGAALEADSVTALGENGSDGNYGMYSYTGATVTLRGGSFTGRGGTYARGIFGGLSGTMLEAEGVTALGENGSDGNYGLYNYQAAATLRGGSFTGRGGTSTWGINNYRTSDTLEAESVTALGENGTDGNYGLYNYQAVITLRGGSFTGRGGAHALGIRNEGTLGAEGITALGEDGSTNYGLGNYTGLATAGSSSFTGSTQALHQDGGRVSLGVSQLDGDASLTGAGILICFQVYDGNYVDYTCP